MHEHMLVTVSRLSDEALLSRLGELAAHDRSSTVELVAHLAELEARPAVHLGKGRSLYLYCTEVLYLSEHAAYNRIGAARAARKFPVILDLMADGSVNVTTVTLLAPHLTPENHRALLAEAKHGTKEEVKAIVRRLSPQPDAPTMIRKLPVAAAPHSSVPSPAPPPAAGSTPPLVLQRSPSPSRPAIELLSPDRYRVQVTIGKETHDTLRRLQDLLSRDIPKGDPAAIIDRALTFLLHEVERKKLGATPKPRKARPIAAGSRHVPAEVRRHVWARDTGRCAFVSAEGTRCASTKYLEYHHVIPFAQGGPTTVQNVALRCRAHNAYEGESVFGKFVPMAAHETSPRYGAINSVWTEYER